MKQKNIKSFTKRELLNELNNYYKEWYWMTYYIENILNDLLKDSYLTATYFSEQRRTKVGLTPTSTHFKKATRLSGFFLFFK